MNKVYNTQDDITSGISNFCLKVFPNMPKPHLKIFPAIIFGMMNSNSCITSDIASSLKSNFSFVFTSSIERRIRRFFNNSRFDGEKFFSFAISDIISRYKLNHKDNRIHIVMDHMLTNDSFISFVLTLRLGKQSIPLYVKSFLKADAKLAFCNDTIFNGIKFVIDIFKDKGFDLIFLGDRWFNSIKIMEFIEDNNYTYVFRLKDNFHCLLFDSKENHDIWIEIKDLFHYKYHSTIYNNITITRKRLYSTNIAIGPSILKNGDSINPWIIVTNGDAKRALKDYAYRFGAIEFLFKAQKSNGFYLEKTATKNILAFKNMYASLCFAITYLTILGIEYSKNIRCYKNIKIEATKTVKGKRVRNLSLLKTGIALFLRALNSPNYVRLPFSFTLYDY